MVVISLPKSIITDIEGTTTSIAFVKECLFPYVRTHIKQYLHKNWHENHLKEDIKLLRDQSLEDAKDGTISKPVIVENEYNRDEVIESVMDNVLAQMDCDRKTTALKQFQGNVWRFGYESGTISGHIYSDVPKALNKWKIDLKIKIFIYSSGSIFAQKLLFSKSDFGDLTHLIDGYFDTNIGPKRDSMSYSNISKEIETNPEHILFLTDIVEEAKAAKNAGINALLLIREGNEALNEEDMIEFPFVSSFDSIEFE